MKSKYDWKRSRTISETILILYKNGKPMKVKEIAKQMGKGVTTISDRLTCLREQKVVNFKKIGRDKFYTVNKEQLRKFIKEKNKEEFNIFSLIDLG